MSSPAHGQAVTPETINAQLQSNDPAALAAAVESIRQLLNDQPDMARGPLRSWVDKLQQAGRYSDAAELAFCGMIEFAFDLPAMESWMQLRIQLLLKSGKTSEAVSSAKSLFNVCRMDSTASALRLLAECLNADRPDDHARVDRLRREQMAGAATQPTTRPATLMGEIKIDASIYAPAIKRFDPRGYLFRADEFRDLTTLGNLLLAADRADEARRVFDLARSKARPDQMLPANEGIARAIKAQDGSIGRANAWIGNLTP